MSTKKSRKFNYNKESENLVELNKDYFTAIETRSDEAIFHKSFLNSPELPRYSNETKIYTAKNYMKKGL